LAEPFQRALVIVAHPDDAESLAAGTVAKLARAGTQVAYCIATNGERGSGDRSTSLVVKAVLGVQVFRCVSPLAQAPPGEQTLGSTPF
jgi:LmbE family N-acetylglucosaminyl deacetylase